MEALDNTTYGPIGRCIYCGATERLGLEHILPLGLGGTATLQKSSCTSCAAITGAVEQRVLRGSLWAARVLLDLKSRTRHRDAPKTYPVLATRQGREETVHVPLSSMAVLVPFPTFVPPRKLTGQASASGIDVNGLVTIRYGKSPEELAAEIGAERVQLQKTEKPAVFARMLAKIAYAYAWANGGIHEVEEPTGIAPCILNGVNSIGDWVGTLQGDLVSHPGVLHRLSLHRDQRGLLIAEIQLFADSPTPSYGVILGKLQRKAA